MRGSSMVMACADRLNSVSEFRADGLSNSESTAR